MMYAIRNSFDRIFYELMFAPFSAAGILYTLAFSVFCYNFDPYDVVRFGLLGTICLATAVFFVRLERLDISLISSIFSGGFFIIAGYKIYNYYFILNPIARHRAVGLFESQHPQLMLINLSMLILFLIGSMYLIYGIHEKLNYYIETIK